MLGAVATAWGSQSPAERAYAAGAAGERQVSEALRRAVDGSGQVLNSRRPGVHAQRGDIDHIVVCPTGVWVVDAKNYRNHTISTSRGLFGKSSELRVGGRDRTALVESVHRQAAVVTQALHSHGFTLEAAPVLCFAAATGLGLSGRRTVDGVIVTRASRVHRVLTGTPRIDADTVTHVTRLLNAVFPPVF